MRSALQSVCDSILSAAIGSTSIVELLDKYAHVSNKSIVGSVLFLCEIEKFESVFGKSLRIKIFGELA